MTNEEQSIATCVLRIRSVLTEARTQALNSLNAAMVAAYWHVGREIVEEEQRGKVRADYGTRLLDEIAKHLTADFGKGFSQRNLHQMRRFFVTYRDRVPRISQPLVAKSGLQRQTASRRPSRDSILVTSVASLFKPELTWTHYQLLMRVRKPEARSFYEIECARSHWSKRELERQISSFLFERLAASRDKEGVMALARAGHEVHTPDDLIKDPYVLEFVGLPESPAARESNLETALIDRLQHFLLELGRDLHFVARQKRISLEGDHFYVDLVFYHRLLRCFLLIDLKTGKLTQEDIGQMLLYTGYFEAEEMREGENPPVGLILCAEKNDAVVRYTLSKTATQVFASRYQLHLPTEDELRRALLRERRLIEERPDSGATGRNG